MITDKLLTHRIEEQGSHAVYEFGDIAYYLLTDEELDEIRELETEITRLKIWGSDSHVTELEAKLEAAERRATDALTDANKAKSDMRIAQSEFIKGEAEIARLKIWGSDSHVTDLEAKLEAAERMKPVKVSDRLPNEEDGLVEWWDRFLEQWGIDEPYCHLIKMNGGKPRFEYWRHYDNTPPVDTENNND